MSVYEYDFDGNCAPCRTIIPYYTFSVGIYQWIPGKKGLKKSPVKVRVYGYTSNPEAVYEKAHEICGQLKDGEYKGKKNVRVRK